MSKIERRRKSGVFLTKGNRDRFRNILRTLYGEKCCWCNEPMSFPVRGTPSENVEDMATIEHHFAKKEGKPGFLFLLRLSHKKCNK